MSGAEVEMALFFAVGCLFVYAMGKGFGGSNTRTQETDHD